MMMTRLQRRDIFDEGFKANKDYFQEMSECPYPEGSEEMEVWLDGWEEAEDPYWY